MLHLLSLWSMISALGAGLSIVGDTKKKQRRECYPLSCAGRQAPLFTFSHLAIVPSVALRELSVGSGPLDRLAHHYASQCLYAS